MGFEFKDIEATKAMLVRMGHLQQEINLAGMGRPPVQAVVRPSSGVFPTAHGDFYEFPALGIQVQVIDSRFVNIGIADGSNIETLDIRSSEFEDFVTLLNYLNAANNG